MEEKVTTDKRLLIMLDLDGTTLANSDTCEIHPKTLAAIKKAKDAGHVICILTGRPWRSSKQVYQELELDTIIANYNGAQIHNPSDENFTPQISFLNLNEVLYILGDERIKKEVTNIAIEGPGWVQLQQNDPKLEKVFGFSKLTKFKVGLDYHRLPLRPTGVIFDVRPETDPISLQKYMRNKFGDLAEFSYWSKGDNEPPAFDIASPSVDKGKVVSLLMRYYDIAWERTVAIGDSFNDVPMFKVANVSVTMANANRDIQYKAAINLDKRNYEGGVGEYLEKLMENPEAEIGKALKWHQKNREKRSKW
ncbi:hydrolase [Mycoplasmopsis agassizii]|uniref:Hydrolase n=1 Tax=Mycoplasmopsis agassizii TaxID=33922 RepID=A0A269TK16_9BACT|nr:Cof-type HAD-IIB family hydrolase [Mycoplasmopsis agassizii]PAK21697.1 hydrolase [Mycoplasmopsis agassizii]